ncbi:hypothetical protein MTO96_041069 [Rhipicephalus appendiculatus]
MYACKLDEVLQPEPVTPHHWLREFQRRVQAANANARLGNYSKQDALNVLEVFGRLHPELLSEAATYDPRTTSNVMMKRMMGCLHEAMNTGHRRLRLNHRFCRNLNPVVIMQQMNSTLENVVESAGADCWAEIMLAHTSEIFKKFGIQEFEILRCKQCTAGYVYTQHGLILTLSAREDNVSLEDVFNREYSGTRDYSTPAVAPCGHKDFILRKLIRVFPEYLVISLPRALVVGSIFLKLWTKITARKPNCTQGLPWQEALLYA